MPVFRVGGHEVSLERSTVEQAVQGKTPGRVTVHVVEVGGVVWPLKQALAEATGLDLLAFTTQEARRVLTRLGFRAFRTS
jgi:hypothetical protein